jgi:hypothetical protein
MLGFKMQDLTFPNTLIWGRGDKEGGGKEHTSFRVFIQT